MSAVSSLAVQNRILLGKLLAIVALMGGFAFLLVPLYRTICEAIGVNDTRIAGRATDASGVDDSRTVRVDFLAGTTGHMPIRFEPVEGVAQVHPGEVTTITYRVVNTTDRVLVGQAVPSFAPAEAGKYFTKLECFCFSNQTFRPGESRLMPVVFYVRRELPADISGISLNYTFFDVTGDKG